MLVNNVGGVRLRVNGFLQTSDADFEASMQLNFLAALRVGPQSRQELFHGGLGRWHWHLDLAEAPSVSVS